MPLDEAEAVGTVVVMVKCHRVDLLQKVCVEKVTCFIRLCLCNCSTQTRSR